VAEPVEHVDVPQAVLGYVASLNRYFNPVLHYLYTADRSHENHVHYDDGTSGQGRLATFTASSGKTTQTQTVQACLVYIWGISVSIDGYYGPATEAATRTALSRIGYSGTLTNSTNYGAFLAESCRAGTGLYTPSLATFEKAEAAKAKPEA
jgi:peptidoglycan hydrolase-like protein with peptidoglycan-binding domain